ncbi:MAG: PaREP1 family protein [Nitrososphaerales archaeon]
MSEVKRYLELNRKYLEEAENLLNKGDHVQASEKLWGAAAEIVKAVASKRGLELKSHRELWEFVTKLDNERPQLNLLKLFHIANSLHINFYENWMTPEAVTKGAEAVKELIEKLQ